MFSKSRPWLQRWFPRAGRPSPRRSGLSLKLSFEILEDRLVPAVINVLSTLDNTMPVVTAGHAGTAADPYQAPSLRSAISYANAHSGGNTINLAVVGTYQITLAGANADNNATGDFDIQPTGGNLTIQNTSGGTAIVDGNHLDRVFDINPVPGNTPKFLVTFQGFTIENGNAQVGDGASGSGGGIRDQGNVSLTLTNVVVANNTATADGGGISMENAVGSTPWTLTVNNSIISGNHAGDAGGGIDTDGKGVININSGTVITGNSTLNQGAGIWLDAITGAVDTVTVANGGNGYTSAPTVSFVPADGNGTGAAGFATVANGAVQSVTLTNSGNGYDMPPTVQFTGGGTNAMASATVVPFQGATLNVTGATITNNSALSTVGGVGGGIGNAGNGTVTITGSTVSGNSAGFSGGGFGDENAVGTLVVTNTVFAGNVAGRTGGGVSVAGPDTSITNTTFRANSGGMGGGLFADMGTTLTFAADFFTENTSFANGGGVFAQGTQATIADTEFRDNSALASGGGLFAGGTTLLVSASTFAGNSAGANGGGIEDDTTGTGAAASFFTNTTLAGNSALNNVLQGSIGGGVDFGNAGNYTGTTTLLNDTVAGNYGFSGGGLAIAHGGVVDVENTIIAGNFVGNAGPDYVGTNGFNPVSLGGNLIGIDSAALFNKTGDQAGSGANPLVPLLGPLQNNGGPTVGATADAILLETQTPLIGSPARGKGLASGAPGLDARGFLRPLFLKTGTLDVGAVESLGVPLTTTSTVPGIGDTNPYGLVFVPANFPTGGVLQPGDLLIANFNNADGVQGTGTTITRITAQGQSSTFFTSTQPGLSDALGILQAGFVIVGNVPNVNNAPGAGSLQVLDTNGNAVNVPGLNGALITDPWSLTVNDHGTTAQVFVSNTSGTTGANGTVVRIDLSIQNGVISVVDEVTVGTGFATRPDAAAFVLGPAGLAYDAVHDILYVASQADNEVFKIDGAGTTMTALAGTGTVVFNDQTHLHSPLGLVLLPNGNLLTANSDAQNADPNQPSEVVEFTTAGQFVGQFPVDPANGGAFGLAETTVNGQLLFAAVDDNANSVLTLTPPTATIVPVAPTPTSMAVNAINIVFSQAVTGLTLADLTLTGPGGTSLLTGNQTLTTTDGIHWTLGNLAGLTSPTGRVAGFTLTVNAAAGVTDGAGNSLQTGASTSFTEVDPALSLQGTTLTVPGTAGKDTFVFQAGPSEQFTLNGVTFTVDPAVVSSVLFQGNGGNDMATLFAAGNGNQATLAPGGGTLQGTGYRVTVSGVSAFRVYASGTNDTATLSDGVGGNALYTNSMDALLVGPTVGILAFGFHSTITTQTAGAADFAFLDGGVGTTSFVSTAGYSYVTSGGVFNEAIGFATTVASNVAGGIGTAQFFDTPGNDTFVATPAYAYLKTSGLFNEAIGFQSTVAYSTSGGNDLAYLFDSAGNDTFVAAPTFAFLRGGGTVNEVIGFQAVQANSTAGGTDTAYLYAAPTGSTFVGAGATSTGQAYSYFMGGNSFYEAVGFHNVFAFGAGASASAFVFASAGNDTFTGQGAQGALTGAAYAITVEDFAAVYAYANANGHGHLNVGAVNYLFSQVGNWM